MKRLNSYKWISVAGAAICVVAMATTALADDENMTATNIPPSAEMLTPQDFVTRMALGNDKEIREGQVALATSHNSVVTNFARRMIKDHSAANQKLARIAHQQELNCPATNAFYETINWPPENLKHPKGLPARALMQHTTQSNEDVLAVGYLQTLSGPAFDQEYAAQAVEDHAATIAYLENAATNLDNAPLKQYAQRLLPTIREHYRMARNMQSKVGATAERTSPASREIGQNN